MQHESFQLEEYAGHKFYIEHVSTYSFGNLFRVHMMNGITHVITSSQVNSKEEAKQEVIDSIKQLLDGRN